MINKQYNLSRSKEYFEEKKKLLSDKGIVIVKQVTFFLPRSLYDFQRISFTCVGKSSSANDIEKQNIYYILKKNKHYVI